MTHLPDRTPTHPTKPSIQVLQLGRLLHSPQPLLRRKEGPVVCPLPKPRRSTGWVVGLHCQVCSAGSGPAARHQLGLIGSAWWVCPPGPQSQLPRIPLRGIPQHPGRQQGCWGQPALRGWWCGVLASPDFLAKRKGAMCSDKWCVNGAPGQGEAPQPDAARGYLGRSPPLLEQEGRRAGASSGVWKVGALPGRSCRPPRGEPGRGGGVLRPHTPGVSKTACWGPQSQRRDPRQGHS